MDREFLLWSGVLLQGAGLAALTCLGAFGSGDGKRPSAFFRVRGLPPFLAGAAALALFALMERHLLLAAAQTVAVFLVFMGVSGGTRGNGDVR